MVGKLQNCSRDKGGDGASMKVELLKIEDVENNAVLTIRCTHPYNNGRVHIEEFIRPSYGSLKMKWLLLPDCIEAGPTKTTLLAVQSQ